MPVSKHPKYKEPKHQESNFSRPPPPPALSALVPFCSFWEKAFMSTCAWQRPFIGVWRPWATAQCTALPFPPNNFCTTIDLQATLKQPVIRMRGSLQTAAKNTHSQQQQQQPILTHPTTNQVV